MGDFLQDSGISVGSRIKAARMMTGLTRKDFGERARISVATLRSWEVPCLGRSGITPWGADRLLKALGEQDVFCTKDWLLKGVGPGPRIISAHFPYRDRSTESKKWGEEESILKDLESFKENNPNPLVMLVSDDAMAPYFKSGDYVGGIRVIGGAAIASMVGLNCILETAGGFLLRRIGFHHKGNSYTLVALNQSVDGYPVMPQVVVKSAAEVVWHRRRRRKL